MEYTNITNTYMSDNNDAAVLNPLNYIISYYYCIILIIISQIMFINTLVTNTKQLIKENEVLRNRVSCIEECNNECYRRLRILEKNTNIMSRARLSSSYKRDYVYDEYSDDDYGYDY